MAKKLVTSYTFTPGVSGVGTVVIAGTYALEQFLLITNVADNIVIYEFDVNTLGGTVTTGGCKFLLMMPPTSTPLPWPLNLAATWPALTPKFQHYR